MSHTDERAIMTAMDGTTVYPDGGLRERKKLRTRQALIDAAFALFARKGFDATTVEEIAEAVEVSSRTFFRYFPSKEDVVLTVAEDQYGLFVAAFEARPPEEPVLTALGEALAETLHACEHGLGGISTEQFECLQQLTLDSPSLFASTLEHATAKQKDLTLRLAARMGVDPAKDFRPHLIASIATCGMRGAADSWQQARGEKVSLSDTIAQAITLLSQGLNYPSTMTR